MKRTFVIFRIYLHLLCLMATMLGLVRVELAAQNVIGGLLGDPSALLDLQSNREGLLIPRMTTAERQAILNPAEGLLIYNTTRQCLELNIGNSSSPDWSCLMMLAGRASALNCAEAVQTGTLIVGVAAAGVTVSIPYLGGNGRLYSDKSVSVSSTGVDGLTATLLTGVFAAGNGSLNLQITGTPVASGVANFALEIGGQSCAVQCIVQPPTVSAFLCDNLTRAGRLTRGVAANGVSAVIPYTGGNGGAFATQAISSTGVSGLTATLPAGFLATGNASVTFTITGTPASSGLARFDVQIGGISCPLTFPVDCGAYLSATEWRVFQCHNLGADTTASPFTPSWSINGNYYQWGRSSVAAPGPSGASSAQANSGAISGWIKTFPPTNAWMDEVKTANDPCPEGFRIPTLAQWGQIQSLNFPSSRIGSWSLDNTNYTSGVQLGAALFFPTAGNRWGDYDGVLTARGSEGSYASATMGPDSSKSWILNFNQAGPIAGGTSLLSTISATSVRCMADIGGVIAGLNCAGANISGILGAGLPASQVRFSVPYLGGNRGYYSALSIPSSGVTGLTAAIVSGNLANGSGELTFTVTGTPSGTGDAAFLINIGGQNCTVTIPVISLDGLIEALNCGAAAHSGTLVSTRAGVAVATVPYTGGNGGAHPGQIITSTGVTGLTAALASGNFDSGGGDLTYVITGAPSTMGTARFALNIGGAVCVLERTVSPADTLSSLNCSSATHAGTLTVGAAAAGVSFTVPYTGGNAGHYLARTIQSTGVTGLTATLAAGILANGSGSLTFTISGTPASSGTARFVIELGGRSCILERLLPCGAYVASGQWKEFMCHNLGATTSAHPFTQSWELNGAYYQWGKSAVAAAAPTGSASAQANSGSITGWSTTAAATGAWADGSKTANDPCPAGFRVPTSSQWAGVINPTVNTYGSFVGSWQNSATNYSSGFLISWDYGLGGSLFLPTAGYRTDTNGTLTDRGRIGLYWSSTAYSSAASWGLWMYDAPPNIFKVTDFFNKTFGGSVRCIAE